MTPNKRDKATVFAKEVARAIIDDPGFRRFVRETVLHILVEQEEQRNRGAVRAFLGACEARGVRVSLDAEGQICSSDWRKIGPDLRAVLIVYREPIMRHLAQFADMERKARERNG
jgi:hypothetical protein